MDASVASSSPDRDARRALQAMRDAPDKITARCYEVLLGRRDDADNDGKNRVGRGLNFESQSYPRRRLR